MCTNRLVYDLSQRRRGRRDLNVSIDRIDPDIDYLVTNIQLVCLRANTMKHTMKEDELYWWAKNIVECKENE